MKKILVMSDSHGNVNNMIQVVKLVRPDMIFHLGDCWSDVTKLKLRFPGLHVERVAGNCDYEEVLEEIISIEGKRIMICHGHTYNVKAGYLNIEMSAKEKEVDAVLFGHTHRVFYDYNNGLLMLNPGSMGSPPRNIPPSYAILYVDGNSGYINYSVEYME